jgi:hypothetical protein
VGLLFALQVDQRRSRRDTLVLVSTKRRFAMGAGLLFGAAVLGVMVLAASPLFLVFWEQGAWFDRALTLFFYASVALYPIVALGSWFFEERVQISVSEMAEKSGSGNRVLLAKHKKMLGIRWGVEKSSTESIDRLEMSNFKEALNEAALKAAATGRSDRYATKGHWILRTPEGFEIERRAKKEDLEFLVFQIREFFQQSTSGNEVRSSDA